MLSTITYSTTHLTLSKKIQYEEWENTVKTFSKLGNCWQWWLGDLWDQGEEIFGESYTQALEGTELALKTVRNVTSVSRSFSPQRRRESLPWSIHRAVVGLSSEKQDEWLDYAEKNGTSTAQLVKLIKQDMDSVVEEPAIDEDQTPVEIPKSSELLAETVEVDGIEIDLTDPTTARNYKKTLDALDTILTLRIPNMYLKGSSVERKIIEVRDDFLDLA